VRLHDDELEVGLPLVRALIEHRLPDLAGRRLRPLAESGSSNKLFRVGDDLLARFPRQPGGSATIAKEARWLPYVASAVPVRTPEVVLVAEPDLGYPEHWSIVRWIDGTTPPVPPAGDRRPGVLAADLARFVTALRGLDVPADARRDPALRWYRAEPLAALDDDVRGYLEGCRALPGLDLDLDACARLWESAMAHAGADRAVGPRWLHGDLVAENLLVSGDRLCAVLDFGGLAVGDPTVDLIVGWEVLGAADRALFRSLLAVDELTWLRGRAWALAIAVMTFPYYWRTMPHRCAARLAMARAVLDDDNS
jgi:aminoglycoside phosphotransferase (APT) family kinase protein